MFLKENMTYELWLLNCKLKAVSFTQIFIWLEVRKWVFVKVNYPYAVMKV